LPCVGMKVSSFQDVGVSRLEMMRRCSCLKVCRCEGMYGGRNE
jgi:hypothetical protein